MSRDPLGYVDYLSLYEAFGDSPVRYGDPFGTQMSLDSYDLGGGGGGYLPPEDIQIPGLTPPSSMSGSAGAGAIDLNQLANVGKGIAAVGIGAATFAIFAPEIAAAATVESVLLTMNAVGMSFLAMKVTDDAFSGQRDSGAEYFATYLTGTALAAFGEAIGLASRVTRASRGAIPCPPKEWEIVDGARVKLEQLSNRFGITQEEILANAKLAQSYLDTRSGNINKWMPRPDGEPGFMRVTLDPSQNRVISAGLNRQKDMNNGISNGKFIPLK